MPVISSRTMSANVIPPQQNLIFFLYSVTSVSRMGLNAFFKFHLSSAHWERLDVHPPSLYSADHRNSKP